MKKISLVVLLVLSLLGLTAGTASGAVAPEAKNSASVVPSVAFTASINLKARGTVQYPYIFAGYMAYHKGQKYSCMAGDKYCTVAIANQLGKSSVYNIQRKLKITKDGIFGSATEAAVKKFQKVNRLTQSGKVDSKTANKLGLIPVYA